MFHTLEAPEKKAGPRPDPLCFRLPGQLSANGLDGRVPPYVLLASCWLWPICS